MLAVTNLQEKEKVILTMTVFYDKAKRGRSYRVTSLRRVTNFKGKFFLGETPPKKRVL